MHLYDGASLRRDLSDSQSIVVIPALGSALIFQAQYVVCVFCRY
jgi:hypothetical protein